MRCTILSALMLSATTQAQTAGTPDRSGDVMDPAQADNAMLFTVTNRVSEGRPSCTVGVMAQWNPSGVQFAGAYFAVHADSDPGDFSDPERLIFGPGTADGIVAPDGDSVSGIISGRLCFPLDPPCQLVPCPNPEAVWLATWSTTDFTPRVVNLSTLTSQFVVYMDYECLAPDVHDSLAEGVGQIIITCYADCDQSTGLGVLDLFDFLCFVNEFNAGAADADCDADGAMSLFDFLCFVNEFNGGC